MERMIDMTEGEAEYLKYRFKQYLGSVSRAIQNKKLEKYKRGMTIDESVEWLISRKEHYEMDDNCQEIAQALVVAIDTMRRYQKIEELYDYWRSGKCEYTIPCMENIGKVLRDENDD